MRPTVLLLKLLQYGENFGLWKVPLLVAFSVQVMFLVFPHGHRSLVNFLPADISLIGALGWAKGISETGVYKQYVKQTLMKTASTHLKDRLGLNLPWNVLLSQRAVIQVRRDYVVFGHVNGKKSKARVQECILCQKRYSNVKLRTVNACAGLLDVRRPCFVYFPQGLDSTIFDIHPSHPGYCRCRRPCLHRN